MNNFEIILLLRKLSFLLEVKGENKFKSQAYNTAADIIEVQNLDVKELVLTQKLKEINGFGKALCEKLEDLVVNGRMKYYEDVTSEIPESLFELSKIDGLGTKRISRLFHELNITDLESLKNSIDNKSIFELNGFGDKLIDKIKQNI